VKLITCVRKILYVKEVSNVCPAMTFSSCACYVCHVIKVLVVIYSSSSYRSMFQ